MPISVVPDSVNIISSVDNPISVKENDSVQLLETLVDDMDRFAKQLELITGLELKRGDS